MFDQRLLARLALAAVLFCLFAPAFGLVGFYTGGKPYNLGGFLEYVGLAAVAFGFAYVAEWALKRLRPSSG